MAASNIRTLRDQFYWRLGNLAVAAAGKKGYGLVTWYLKGLRSGELDWDTELRKVVGVGYSVGACSWCGSSDDVDAQQIVQFGPVGSIGSWNAAPTCSSCTAERGRRNVLEWKGKKGFKGLPLPVSGRILGVLFVLADSVQILDVNKEDIDERLCRTCPSSSICGMSLLDAFCLEAVLGHLDLPDHDPRIAKDVAYWAYANLAMAHAAVKDAAEQYKPLHASIRDKLYIGLQDGSKSVRPAKDDERIKIECSDHCWYCGKRTKLTLDHMVPPSRGGAETGLNYVWACRSCNSSKGDRDFLVWWGVKYGGTPPLLLIRRYLKLFIAWLETQGRMNEAIGQIDDCPFATEHLPEVYPAPAQLSEWVNIGA